jgi:hypothetical protein
MPIAKPLVQIYFQEGLIKSKEEFAKRFKAHKDWAIIILQEGFCLPLTPEQKADVKFILNNTFYFKNFDGTPGLT